MSQAADETRFERQQLPVALMAQEGLDRLPAVAELPLDTLCTVGGRQARYLQVGEADWRPFVFFGGLATSVGAFALTEFARSLRESLQLRAISVERNGFGETPFDPSLGYAEAVEDVLAVLGVLEVKRFAIVAFSGGGPFAARLAAAAGDRVLSLHLAAATTGGSTVGNGTATSLFADAAEVARDPGAMWEFPPESPVHLIPGFDAAAREEGIRALVAGGRGELALAHEWRLLGGHPLPDLSAVKAPAYLYWGANDSVVAPAQAQAWRRALPRVAALRAYEGEGHDVQYNHWSQILVDVAGA